MKSKRKKPCGVAGLSICGALMFSIAALLQPCYAQSMSLDRGRGREMLKAIKDEIKKNYYDPGFHGMDIDARFQTADEKIKQATSVGQMNGIIAQALIDLNDSHTFFLPPSRTYRTEYGWQMQMIGDKCYVVAVKPDSDAEGKGLRPGDQLLAIDGHQPVRDNFWIVNYLYNALRPQAGMSLVVKSPDGKEKQLDVMAKIRQGRRLYDLTGSDGGSGIWDLIRDSENESRLHRHRYIDAGEDVFIWKMPGFDLLKPKVDDMMSKVKKRKALILDLRGNGGGYEETLLRLIGNMFDKDIQLGELKRRKDSKPMVAKTRGDNVFGGKLVVLVDSNSGSASELFARVVQLEKRGTVVGDRSAGAVMRARQYEHTLGADTIIPYGVSVTDADIIMSDGKSLERVGVVPDELLLPSAKDLAANRDPVMARAAQIVGLQLDPAKAGALFPIEWRK